MEGEAPCSTAKQVRTTALQLPGAGSAQDKAKPLALDEAVHFVQKRRDLLDLVNDDGMSAR